VIVLLTLSVSAVTFADFIKLLRGYPSSPPFLKEAVLIKVE